MARAPLRILLAATLAAGLPTASAQAVVGTLGAATADRDRGLAGPYGGPVLRAGASVDLESGFYASGLLQYQVDAGRRGRDQWLAGISQPLAGELSWDLGVRRSVFDADPDYDRTEWMAGLARRDGALRAWWSPRQAAWRPASLYVELEAARALTPSWRLVGHVGRFSAHGERTRVDALAGLSWTAGSLEARLTVDGLVAGRPAGGVLADGSRDTGATVALAVTWAF